MGIRSVLGKSLPGLVTVGLWVTVLGFCVAGVLLGLILGLSLLHGALLGGAVGVVLGVVLGTTLGMIVAGIWFGPLILLLDIRDKMEIKKREGAEVTHTAK